MIFVKYIVTIILWTIFELKGRKMMTWSWKDLEGTKRYRFNVFSTF